MHRVKYRFFSPFAFAALMTLAACDTTSGVGTTTDWSAVTDQEWQLVSVKDGRATVSPTPQVKATVTFSDDGMVTGNAGCNQYSGGYTQAGSSLGITQLAMTRKMCVAEEAMKIENALSGAFVLVESWDVTDGRLVLKDTDGNATIILRKTKRDTVWCPFCNTYMNVF
ncbi:META domain-containing protein [Thalassospira sp. HF15]|uniref:META domain-containing protein n=1 Tax=Thalassospira sp. HF15 TaxID=2722755 RepID=UPI00142FEF72|nr:META domain-containing protein [Thalassospira sp. HF15]NIY76739.1 META domain-containing protein [Thalassospira sp. HF15]